MPDLCPGPEMDRGFFYWLPAEANAALGRVRAGLGVLTLTVAAGD